MMKLQLVGRYLDDIEPLLKERGFEIVDTGADLIIAHGGDGTLFGTERTQPGIPKFPVRDQRTADFCAKHSYKSLFNLLERGELKRQELMKLSGKCGKAEVVGMNDVFIHNFNRVSAVRYRVWIDEELYAPEVVGDGVGAATPLGSTAYYRSITHGTFRVGIGLAFSNSTEVTNHLVVSEDSAIRIQITRGPAILVADNDSEKSICIDEGDEVIIQKSADSANIVGLDHFMCNKCRRLRNVRKHPFEED